MIGSAVRIERFEDFGTTMNSKLAGRVQLADRLALRASVSSGFRAPTPGQQNAFNVSTQYDIRLMDLVNNGTIPSTSAVARLRGGRPLQPERSINYAAGVVIERVPFTLTADYFRIDLADRLALTELFALTPSEVDRLVAEGVTSAGNLTNFRFFTNDFATTTQGIDMVSTWTPPALGGRTAISAAVNHTDTTVTLFNPRVLGASRIRRLEQALPLNRWNAVLQQRAGGWDLLARLNYYGGWLDDDDDAFFDGRPILDVEAAWPVTAATTLAFGARNVLDTYPDINANAPATGERYSEYTPWGFGGRVLLRPPYARVAGHSVVRNSASAHVAPDDQPAGQERRDAGAEDARARAERTGGHDRDQQQPHAEQLQSAAGVVQQSRRSATPPHPDPGRPRLSVWPA